MIARMLSGIGLKKKTATGTSETADHSESHVNVSALFYVTAIPARQK